MHLISNITINRSPEHVWQFFMDIHNLVRWDHSVAEVEVLTPQQKGVGVLFDTIAPSRDGKPGKRMHYIVAQLVRKHLLEAELINDQMFSYASWRMELESVAAGTLVTCFATFNFRWNYIFLGPVLWINRYAIKRDLGYLKARIEDDYPKN